MPYICNYGTKEQKEKYLPKLASGEWIGAIASKSSCFASAFNKEVLCGIPLTPASSSHAHFS